jgi:hypothetical protein
MAPRVSPGRTTYSLASCRGVGSDLGVSGVGVTSAAPSGLAGIVTLSGANVGVGPVAALDETPAAPAAFAAGASTLTNGSYVGYAAFAALSFVAHPPTASESEAARETNQPR